MREKIKKAFAWLIVPENCWRWFVSPLWGLSGVAYLAEGSIFFGCFWLFMALAAQVIALASDKARERHEKFMAEIDDAGKYFEERVREIADRYGMKAEVNMDPVDKAKEKKGWF